MIQVNFQTSTKQLPVIGEMGSPKEEEELKK